MIVELLPGVIAETKGDWIGVRYVDRGLTDLYARPTEGRGLVCCTCEPAYELPHTETDEFLALVELRKHAAFHGVDRSTYIPLERALAEVAA